MKQFKKENVHTGELAIYKVLNQIAARYNKEFDLLILPQAIGIDEEKRTLLLPYYEGEIFNSKWTELNGGLALGLDLSKEIPLLLKDLSKVNTSFMLSNEAISEIPKLAFNHEEAVDYFGNIAEKFKGSHIISNEDYIKVKSILNFQQTSALILNNGDFYPRNFIRQPNGRIVLIDWETWNDHSPFYVLDHIENIAAVAFVHMWGNTDWQATYLKELKKLFSFDEKSFDKGVVMKSLEMANFWSARSKSNELIMYQIRILKEVLDKN